MGIIADKTIVRNYLGVDCLYDFRDGVIKQDYYKDHLVSQLPMVMDEILFKKKNIRILDMATGHGYTLVIISKYYEKFISKIIAYDINPRAVDLARSNIELNKCPVGKIEFRSGSLYDPLSVEEKFDLIVSALPPVPVEANELSMLPNEVKAHHWIDSTAGRTGRNLLDGMISGAHIHLSNYGVILTSQADFQNATISTIDVMQRNGFHASKIGGSRAVKLKDTKLTLARKKNIQDIGYNFTIDDDGDEQFFLETYKGESMHG